MSGQCANVVRGYFAAFGNGGLDAAARFWDRDIEWRAVEGAADDVGVIRGYEEMRAYYADWIATMEDLRAEVGEILFEDDDRVAVVVQNSGRGRASGVPVHGRYYAACVVKDGRIVLGREYATAEEAVHAVRTM